MLEVFITSRVRRKIVVVYAKYPDFKTHVRGLAKLIKEDPGNIQRELKKLEKVGFLKSEKKGNTKVYFTNKHFIEVAKSILNDDTYFNIENNNPLKINFEYVSANPTGDLHLGHARGAIYGDTMVRLLERTGHHVDREYYVNDAGGQINNLGLTPSARAIIAL